MSPAHSPTRNSKKHEGQGRRKNIVIFCSMSVRSCRAAVGAAGKGRGAGTLRVTYTYLSAGMLGRQV